MVCNNPEQMAHPASGLVTADWWFKICSIILKSLAITSLSFDFVCLLLLKSHQLFSLVVNMLTEPLNDYSYPECRFHLKLICILSPHEKEAY